MKKLLLSTMAISAIATSVFAQAPTSGNQANATLTGYNYQFAGTKTDNCDNKGVPGRDISTEYPAYGTYDVTGGELVITKDGSKQLVDWESFPFLFTDAACNVVEVDLTSGAAIEIKVNASVAVPQMMFAIGGTDDRFTDNSPILQPLVVGDNTITGTISDWKTWDAKDVDKTKVKAAVLGFRTSYDDVTKSVAAATSGTFKVAYIKIGNQTGFSSVFESNVVSGALRIFPSPATEQLNVNFDAKENVTVSLTDVTGRVVLSQNVSAGTQNLKFNVSNFSEGLYFVTISGASGSHTEKVMVK